MPEPTEKPAIPAGIAAELDALEYEASQSGGGPGLPPPPLTGADKWAAIIREMGRPAFDAVAPNWKVTNDEITELAAGVAPCLEKYLPIDDDFVMPVELIAVATIFAFASRHAGQPRRIVADIQATEVKQE